MKYDIEERQKRKGARWGLLERYRGPLIAAAAWEMLCRLATGRTVEYRLRNGKDALLARHGHDEPSNLRLFS